MRPTGAVLPSLEREESLPKNRYLLKEVPFLIFILFTKKKIQF